MNHINNTPTIDSSEQTQTHNKKGIQESNYLLIENETHDTNISDEVSKIPSDVDVLIEQKLKSLGLPMFWKEVTKDYNLIKKIGKGSFGTVVEAQCRQTGLTVAIKCIEGFAQYDYDCVKLVREIQIMKQIQTTSRNGHCSFVPIIFDLITPANENQDDLSKIFMVLEKEETDLRELFKLGPNVKISEEQTKLILYNLICALKYLHSANVIHRDIKPANILINADCQVKICDYGISRTFPESMIGSGSGNSKRVRDSLIKTQIQNNCNENDIKNMINKKVGLNIELNKNKKRSMSSHVNSRWFRAPEIALVEKQYDGASDVWSLGCCLYELMQMRNGTKKNNLNGYALFPSGHCFPLSPKQENKFQQGDDSDLVNRMLEMIKPLDDDDLCFISQPDAKSYIQKKQRNVNKKQSVPLLTNIQQSDPELQDILLSLLEFNPFFRSSTVECLMNKYFDDIRNPLLERSAPQKIKLSVDQDDVFDYKAGHSSKYTKSDYLKIIQDEVADSRKNRLEKLKKAAKII